MELTAENIDEVLAETFPASDPPAWTAGIARPAVTEESTGERRAPAARSERPGVIDVSRPAEPERPWVRGTLSLLGAVGIVMLVPFVILAIGTPLALVARAIVAAIGWALASIG